MLQSCQGDIMQNYYYQNNTPPFNGQQPQYQMPYFPIKPQLTPKQAQRRTLRKESNKLGFFILIYFVVMIQISSIASSVIKEMRIVTKENQTIFVMLIQLIASLGSVLAATLFYRLISRRRLSESYVKSRLNADMLIPMVLLGMGAAMMANQLAAMFDNNISLFRLENSASMSESTHTVPEILLYVLSTAIVPAFAEELAFRGIFMNVLRRFGDAFAIIASAVVFGAMHGNTTQIIFAFTLGLIFAYVDCKANSIIPSIIIHFFNNFYAVVTDIIGSNSGFDSGTVAAIRVGIIIMFCFTGLLSYIYLSKRDKDFFKTTNEDSNGLNSGSLLSLKEKNAACFTSVGVIISLAVFSAEMILNLIPQDVQQEIVRSVGG